MKNISLARKVYNWWPLQTLANILHRKFPPAASLAKTASCGRTKCILFCVMHHQQNCHLSPDSRIFIVSSNLWSKLQSTAWFFRCQDELAFAKILFWLTNWLYLSLKLWEAHKYETPVSCEKSYIYCSSFWTFGNCGRKGKGLEIVLQNSFFISLTFD